MQSKHSKRSKFSKLTSTAIFATCSSESLNPYFNNKKRAGTRSDGVVKYFSGNERHLANWEIL